VLAYAVLMQLHTRLLRALFAVRRPIVSGSLLLPGLERELEIRRDRFGIVYVNAQTEADAWFGLGFAQAQDRAFQLELRQRTARGTLSEIFGEETLSIDRLSRRIGFLDSARRQLSVLDAEVRAQVDAFVRGINAGLSAGGPRPIEFLLLRFQPTPWEPADVLAFGKLLSFLLLGNWDVELARYKVLLEDGAGALRDLDPTPYPETHPTAGAPGKPAGRAIDRLGDDLARLNTFVGASGGSNAWAVAGSRTRSGRPIVANDPHLEASLPAHWYLAQLRTPEWAVAGATIVGAPAVLAGHNGFAAWGLTAGLADSADLFVEEIGADGRSVLEGGEFVPCQIRREVITVRGKPPVFEDVLITRRGPIIGPALQGEVGAISLRAVWLDAKPVRGFLRSHRANSFGSFKAEFEHWPLVSQNVVYAAESGVIAWQLVGEVPRRRKGWGTLPQSGADPEGGWLEDGVPFAEMPWLRDPDAGYVVTANNKPLPERSGGPFLGVDWLDGYRAARIDVELSSRRDWDLESTMRLQRDEKTLAWDEVREILLSLPGESPESSFALSLLRQWDGVVAVDSAAASVFELFVREMARRIAKSRAPKAWPYALSRGFSDLLPVTTFLAGRVSRVLRRLKEQPPGWFERPWPEEMEDALATVVRDLTARFGEDPVRWGWGRIRPLTLEHPLGRVKPLASLLNRGPFPWGGDGNTVSQAGGAPGRSLGSPPVIASLRMAIEVGDWDNASFVLPGGQSGDPLSPHYDDMLPVWREGKCVPIAWSPAAVHQATVSTLRLRPL